MADGWAYKRLYTTEDTHSTIGSQPPITRLNNLPGHHS